MSEHNFTPTEERVARKLCELRGIDPEQSVAHGCDPDSGAGITLWRLQSSPAWELVAREVRAALQMREAIRFVYDTFVAWTNPDSTAPQPQRTQPGDKDE